MIITEATAYSNQPFASVLRLAKPNGQGAFPLTSAYLVRLWRYVNGAPTLFVSAAPVSITADANFTTVQYAFTAPQMNVAEGYGTIELYDTTAAQTIVSAALRIVPPGTVYQPEFAQPLVLYSETVTCIVEAFYTLNAVADNGITNAKLQDMASGTVKARISAGAGDPENVTFSQLIAAMGLRKGQNALSLVPPALLGRKSVIADFIGGGFASIDDAGDIYSALENIPGLVLTNASGGKTITCKKLMANAAANSFRYHHLPDGTPSGILIEGGFSYLNKKTNPLIADLDAATNVSNSSAPAGWPANAIAFGDASVGRFAGYNVTVTSGTDYYGAFLIVMNDSSSPAVAATIGGAGDFAVYGMAGVASKNPDTGAAGARISGPFAGSVYLVEGYWTASATTTVPLGIDKRAGNSAKTFNVIHFQFGTGRYPLSLFDNATAVPNARTADAVRIPVNGFSLDQMTFFGEYVHPKRDNINSVPLQFYQGSSARIVTQLTGNLISAYAYDGAASSGGSVNSLVPGSRYRFAIVLDGAAKKTRCKVQGFAAPADSAFGALNLSPVGQAYIDVGSSTGTSLFLNDCVSIAGVTDRAWTTAEIAQWVG